jgi:hypothetical protein
MDEEVLRAKFEFWKSVGVLFVNLQGSGEKDLQFGVKGGATLKIWVVKGFSGITFQLPET